MLSAARHHAWFGFIPAILFLFAAPAAVSAEVQPTPEQLFYEAGALAKQGKLPEAIAKLEQAHATEPGNANIVANLAFYSGQAGMDEKAAGYYAKLAQLEPDNAKARIGHAHHMSMALAKQRRYDEAIALLEKLEIKEPAEIISIGWNLGQLNADAGHHEKALNYWKSLVIFEPRNMHLQSKIIQAHQALGQMSARDQAIERILSMYRNNDDPAYIRRNMFCREQYRIGDWKILVFQYLDPGSKNQLFYRYTATDATGEEKFRLSLGSYQSTTDFARQSGEIPSDARLYHLDFYEKTTHRTYGMFKTQPGYDELRGRTEKILEEIISQRK